jgi:Cysteine rich repeat
MSRPMSHIPTLWTTLRDFGAVILVCIIGAVALYVLINPVRAEGLPPRPYDNHAYGDYDPGPRPAWVACSPDVHRYCPNVLPGGGRILSCLAGNKDRLTLECHDALVRAWVYYRR